MLYNDIIPAMWWKLRFIQSCSEECFIEPQVEYFFQEALSIKSLINKGWPDTLP